MDPLVKSDPRGTPLKGKLSRALRRFGRSHREGARRACAWAMTCVMAFNTLVSALGPTAAYADARRAFVPMSAPGDYVQVDDSSEFFNEGHYLNQLKNSQDPPFVESDFECRGGHVVDVGRNTDGKIQDIYKKSNIWPYLIGNPQGARTWSFISDEKYGDADGASVSMLYREVGTLEDASDTGAAPGPMVDIKVTYSIAQAAMKGHESSYAPAYKFDGRPVIQFTDNFSYGVFQFGIDVLDTTFEFFRHDTGEKLNFDDIYYTNTSQDKGEMVAFDADRIVSEPGKPGVWLSSAAPSLNNPRVDPRCRYEVIPGTRLYNGGHHDAADGMVSYSGCPAIYNTNGEVDPSLNYVDTIGDDSYFWRSSCYHLDMSGGSSVTARKIAAGSSDWTDSFDIPDPARWDNGGMMYSTHNFLPLTNPAPKAPHKTINGGTDTVTDVGIGDTVHYEVSQPVHDLGGDGMVRYHKMVMTDNLPDCVEYVDGSAEVTDTFGKALPEKDYSVDYDGESRTLTIELTEDYLQKDLVYNGGEVTFKFDVKATDQPGDDLETVKNAATVQVNELPQDTNVVEYEPIRPVLDIEKHAVLDHKPASAINSYEYLNHDENPDKFSTVHYEGYMQNVADKTRAHNVTLYDELAPGLTLVPGTLKVHADGVEPIETEEKGADGWVATFDNLDPWVQVSFEYDCYTTGEGNGTEVVNTAKTWATNVELGNDGAEDRHASDDGEVYVNDPNLVLKKTVSESPIQNDDYQRGEEYRVGDEFTYTVTMVNDVPGTFAKNVRLTDDDLPAGFELVGDVQAQVAEKDGRGYKIPYPIAGKSDSVHGEEETRTIEWKLDRVKRDNGSWGFAFDINYLDYNRPVTITFKVRAKESMNGYEVYNRARATADNQPDDVFLSKDGRTGEDYTVVWINTPEFQLDKSVRKTDGSYQVGDTASYDVELKGLKTPGTLARNTTLEDEFLQEGTTIEDKSFVITDKPTEDKPQDISGKVELNRFVGKQGWHIDMTQVYGDDKGYWVCSEDWRPLYKDGEESRVQGEHNPVKAKPEYDKEDCESDEVTPGHDYFNVHYDATINDMALQNQVIHNKATADSDEGFPVHDDAGVTVIGAALDIVKDSTDDGSFEVGDVAEYELTVTNNSTGTAAEDVQIEDRFTTAAPGTVSIVEGSIRMFDTRNKEIALKPEQITYTRNESGGIFGFHIDTDCDLKHNDKLTVRYKVKYLANNGGQVITNVADAWADNAPKVSDEYETWPSDMDQSDLRVDKGSDKQVYKGGEKATYTHHIANLSDKTAVNVRIHDEITKDSAGIAQVVKGSVRIWDQNGKAVPYDRITYVYANGGQCIGFDVETGRDLDPDEFLDVQYQVVFDKVEQDAQVHNKVWVAADNTGRAEDELDVQVTPDGNPPLPPDPGPDPDPDPDEPKLAIVKDSNKGWYKPGETARYTLLVTNGAAGTTAEDVQITDSLAAEAREHAKIAEGTVDVTDARGEKIAVKSVSYEKDSRGRAYGIKIDTGYDLAHDGAIRVSYDVEFDGAAVEKTTDLVNRASADASNTPEAEDDHKVTLDTEGHPELRLEKTADKKTVAPGDKLTYTVRTWQPAKGQTAKGVVLTDDLPKGFSLDQDSVKVEKDGKAQTVDAEFPKGKIRVRLGDVKYGEEWTVSYTGTVDEGFLGDNLKNKVTGESPDIPDKPSDETVTPVGNPKLEVVKDSDKKAVAPGDELAWTIKVTQTEKGSTATNVVVNDELPEGFTAKPSDVKVADGRGNSVKANVMIDGAKMTVELGDLAYNDPVTITVKGKVDEKFTGDKLHNVAAASAENVPDKVEDDADVAIGEDPDMAIDKKADSKTVKPGQKVSYTVTASVGGSDVRDAVVTDELPRGLTFVEGTVKVYLNDRQVEKPKIEVKGQKLTYEAGDLKAGEEVRIEYQALCGKQVKDGTELVNVATVSGKGIDPIEGEATVTVGDVTVPDVSGNTPTNGKDPGKDLGKTGDMLAQNLPAITAVVAALILICLVMYKRDNIYAMAQASDGPLAGACALLMSKLGARAETGGGDEDEGPDGGTDGDDPDDGPEGGSPETEEGADGADTDGATETVEPVAETEDEADRDTEDGSEEPESTDGAADDPGTDAHGPGPEEPATDGEPEDDGAAEGVEPDGDAGDEDPGKAEPIEAADGRDAGRGGSDADAKPDPDGESPEEGDVDGRGE